MFFTSDQAQRKPVTVSLASTLASEAALAGCPVGVLGGVHFLRMLDIAVLREPGEWTKLIGAEPAHNGAIVCWYEEFLATYCFAGNFMRGQTALPQLSECVQKLIEADQSR